MQTLSLNPDFSHTFRNVLPQFFPHICIQLYVTQNIEQIQVKSICVRINISVRHRAAEVEKEFVTFYFDDHPMFLRTGDVVQFKSSAP